MRRRLLIACVALAAVALTAATLIGNQAQVRIDVVDPYAWGVQMQPDGERAVILPGTEVSYLPGSRVLAPHPGAPASEHRAADRRAQEARQWLDAATIPGAGSPYADMVEHALLDLHALTVDGAALAGYNPNWRYVWPRDASFIAVALATAGHPQEAAAVLGFLQDVQHPDGTFEARYLPDATGPPDQRGLQTDGTGWALWATDHVLATLGPDDPLRGQIHADLHPLLTRSTHQLLAQVDTPSALPPPSADYWEHRERDLTLGTVAPVLAGLHAASQLWAEGGQADLAEQSALAAQQVQTNLVGEFAPTYARYADGSDRDAATAFLLPPFQPTQVQGGFAAWQASIEPMRRPAGGLAPGAGWAEQSLSWTPQTSLYALAAAHNDEPELAWEWLTWIDTHRTPLGAIPEKVSPDGSPAAVAPLAWSAAVVVLAVAELERRGELPEASG